MKDRIANLASIVGLVIAATITAVMLARLPSAPPVPSVDRNAPIRLVREFSTLTGALAHAKGGDVIELGPGRYEFHGVIVTQTVKGTIRFGESYGTFTNH